MKKTAAWIVWAWAAFAHAAGVCYTASSVPADEAQSRHARHFLDTPRLSVTYDTRYAWEGLVVSDKVARAVFFCATNLWPLTIGGTDIAKPAWRRPMAWQRRQNRDWSQTFWCGAQTNGWRWTLAVTLCPDARLKTALLCARTLPDAPHAAFYSAYVREQLWDPESGWCAPTSRVLSAVQPARMEKIRAHLRARQWAAAIREIDALPGGEAMRAPRLWTLKAYALRHMGERKPLLRAQASKALRRAVQCDPFDAWAPVERAFLEEDGEGIDGILEAEPALAPWRRADVKAIYELLGATREAGRVGAKAHAAP